MLLNCFSQDLQLYSFCQLVFPICCNVTFIEFFLCSFIVMCNSGKFILFYHLNHRSYGAGTLFAPVTIDIWLHSVDQTWQHTLIIFSCNDLYLPHLLNFLHYEDWIDVKNDLWIKSHWLIGICHYVDSSYVDDAMHQHLCLNDLDKSVFFVLHPWECIHFHPRSHLHTNSFSPEGVW